MHMQSASHSLPNLRTSAIVVTVLMLHVCGLWALQSGLLHRIVAGLVVPVEVFIDMSPTDAEPTPPNQSVPQTPPPPAPRSPVPQPTAATAPQTAPTPLASPATPAEPHNTALNPAPVALAASLGGIASGNASAMGISNTSSSPGTAIATSRASALELPSNDAQYLNNPTPAYPALSKRLGEQGKVVIRTLIGADGTPEQAQIKESSGYDRLDQAALATVMKWRYVPGKRSGVAEAMWFDVPFNWVLR